MKKQISILSLIFLMGFSFQTFGDADLSEADLMKAVGKIQKLSEFSKEWHRKCDPLAKEHQILRKQDATEAQWEDFRKREYKAECVATKPSFDINFKIKKRDAIKQFKKATKKILKAANKLGVQPY